ncbi:hypothetical protein CBR_g80039 [Chara braunii]|uniref:ALA-interacting subunit n=1 Tax=Chara braunii TaxID=69332 RepID=A0A388JKZ1_CHABU|nr:hypothetical protein CBR_g80039 [Chara braunii]|eukprot:GBG46602.1 hypothetical protein CBR_g80039 [Chara braunii]
MDGRASVANPRQNTEISELDGSVEGDEVRGGGPLPGLKATGQKSRGTHSGSNRGDADARPASDSWENEASSRSLGVIIDNEEVSFEAGLGPGPTPQGQQYMDTSDSEALLQSDGNGSSSATGASKGKSRLKHFSFSRSGSKPDSLLSSIGSGGSFETLGGASTGKGGERDEGAVLGSSADGFSRDGDRELEMAPTTPRFPKRASLPPAQVSRASDWGTDASGPPAKNDRRLTYPPPRSGTQMAVSSASASLSGIGGAGLVVGGGLGGALNNPLGTGSQVIREGLTKMPKYSRLSQQELSLHGSILLTPKVMITILFVVAIVLIPMGAITFEAARSVVEYRLRYDQFCLSNLPSNPLRDAFIRDPATSKSCTIPFRLDKGLKKGTVAVYYELSRFYANHRKYVDSRDNMQLRGSVTVPGSCASQKENEAGPILPCGIVAWSFFNDSFAFGLQPTGEANVGPVVDLPVSADNLAWRSRRNAFGAKVEPINFNANASTRGGGNLTGPLRENERFIIWMQSPAWHTVRKLWGRIQLNETVQRSATLTVQIQNMYNSYAYDGEKSLILTTTTWLGGNNDFIGVSFFMVGCVAFILAVIFSLLLILFPRPLGELGMLSWNRTHEDAAREAQAMELARQRLQPSTEPGETQSSQTRQSVES